MHYFIRNNSKSVCFLIKPFHTKLQDYTPAPEMFKLQSLKATTDLSRNGMRLQVHTLTHVIISLRVRLTPTLFDNWPFRHVIVASVTYAKSKISCSKRYLYFFSKFLFMKLLLSPQGFFLFSVNFNIEYSLKTSGRSLRFRFLLKFHLNEMSNVPLVAPILSTSHKSCLLQYTQ